MTAAAAFQLEDGENVFQVVEALKSDRLPARHAQSERLNDEIKPTTCTLYMHVIYSDRNSNQFEGDFIVLNALVHDRRQKDDVLLVRQLRDAIQLAARDRVFRLSQSL